MSFSFAKQVALKSSRRPWIYGFGLAAFGGLTTAYSLSKDASREDALLQSQSHNLVNFNPYKLEGKETYEFPW